MFGYLQSYGLPQLEVPMAPLHVSHKKTQTDLTKLSRMAKVCLNPKGQIINLNIKQRKPLTEQIEMRPGI